MRPVEFGEPFDVRVYNALGTVEEADRSVKEDSRLDEFLNASARLFASHGMEKRFGVALLHRHCDCNAMEYMIEYPEVIDGEHALITSPMAAEPHQENAVPAVWSILGDRFYPLEYTRDALARDLYLDGDIPPEFLDEFVALRNASPIGTLLGLAVVERGFYNGAGDDDIALEFSNYRERCNVVFLRDRGKVVEKTIETAWTFERAEDPTRTCIRTCRKQCWSVEGGHDKKHDEHHSPW
jgi:hypothetical protein